ncbi:hypothetical protein P389DRAFT_195564 [Cystobasidium minutum MCA 4210]|uniref:uncharacterized protein n=1 Tax=Cystobasidium minutum MCA 4210 TaxID=1397322 RepID=UPI0034CE09A6|eukprot:jgi/Rhomi1/195564/gm1.3778_g
MTCSSSTTSTSTNTRTILDFLPPPSARKHIKQPMRRMSLHSLPSPSSSSSSSSSYSSSSCFSTVSSSGTPPSDHGDNSHMKDTKTDVEKATREYHAAVATWTAKTWQAVRFVIEQRSRHPAYNNPSPRARSKSPHLPVQNHTSIHSLTTQSASNSSSCDITPLSANSRDSETGLAALPTRLNSFKKQQQPSSNQSNAVSGLSALFAAHASVSSSLSSDNA